MEHQEQFLHQQGALLFADVVGTRFNASSIAYQGFMRYERLALYGSIINKEVEKHVQKWYAAIEPSRLRSYDPQRDGSSLQDADGQS